MPPPPAPDSRPTPSRQKPSRQKPSRQKTGRQETGRQETGRQETGRQETGRQKAGEQRGSSVLERGAIEIQGRMPWSSNGTFLVTVADGDEEVAAIYKPGRAERPLWDFPDGLYRREVAAFELARQLGWDMVPETILRHDGPLGEGSLQRFVDADFEQHYFTLLEEERHHPALRRMATFDLVANNADRKGGHCLLDRESEIWGIDHGLCFHTQSKIRTVIWDFAGERIDEDLVRDLERFEHQRPSAKLRELLHEDEVDALLQRIRRLVARPRFPEPRSGRPYPWPLV